MTRWSLFLQTLSLLHHFLGLYWGGEVAISAGSTVAEVSRQIGVTQQTFYRWRTEYGGLKIDQARRLKQLETENGRLRRAVADLTLDNQILREATEGNF